MSPSMLYVHNQLPWYKTKNKNKTKTNKPQKKKKTSVLHGSIDCICCKFYLLLCTGGKHLLIHRTCCLLLLVGGRLRLGALGSMFIDAVVQQNSSHNSRNEGYYCRSCNCNPHSRQAVSDSMCTIWRGREILLVSELHSSIPLAIFMQTKWKD